MKLILLLSFLSLCTIAIAQVDYGRDPSPLPLSTNSIQEEPTENPTQLYQFAWYAPEEIGRAKHYEKLEIGMAVPRNVKTRF